MVSLKAFKIFHFTHIFLHTFLVTIVRTAVILKIIELYVHTDFFHSFNFKLLRKLNN